MRIAALRRVLAQMRIAAFLRNCTLPHSCATAHCRVAAQLHIHRIPAQLHIAAFLRKCALPRCGATVSVQPYSCVPHPTARSAPDRFRTANTPTKAYLNIICRAVII
jgi:hypothetical protein